MTTASVMACFTDWLPLISRIVDQTKAPAKFSISVPLNGPVCLSPSLTAALAQRSLSSCFARSGTSTRVLNTDQDFDEGDPPDGDCEAEEQYKAPKTTVQDETMISNEDLQALLDSMSAEELTLIPSVVRRVVPMDALTMDDIEES